MGVSHHGMVRSLSRRHERKCGKTGLEKEGHKKSVRSLSNSRMTRRGVIYFVTRKKMSYIFLQKYVFYCNG